MFARIPVVTTASRSAVLGAVGGCVEPVLARKGAKNRGWFFRAVEAQKAAAANKKIDEYVLPATLVVFIQPLLQYQAPAPALPGRCRTVAARVVGVR